MKFSSVSKAWLAAPAFVLAAFILYGNTLSSAFHFDDFIFIVQNPELTDPLDIRTIWGEGSAPTRFVAYWTFAWNYYFHQYDVTGYHVVNILIHALNTMLVYWVAGMLATRLAESNRMPVTRVRAAAVIAALIFLCHPLQTQAVTYLCQRFASLATLFYVLAVGCYVRGRMTARPVWWGAAGVAALAGMFTKQVVMTLPVMVLLTEWFFFRDAKITARAVWRHWKFIAAGGAVFLLIPAVYSFNVQSILLREYESLSHRGDTLNLWTYFLTQSRVIWTYIRLLVFPVGQNLLYDFTTSTVWWEPKVIAGFSGIIALTAVSLAWRRRYPLAAFGVLWFFTTLLVESSIIPIRHVIFEHRLYLPMFGFGLVAAQVFTARRLPVKAGIAVVTAAVVTLSVLTVRRNAVWRDGITLWSDVLEKSPGLIRPYTHLATAYLNQGNYERALEIYSAAIAADPQRAESYNNRGNVYTVLKQYDLALDDYRQALVLDPTLEKTYNNVGIIYNKRKQFAEALDHYNRAIALNPTNAGAYFNRANVYLQRNELDRAFADYTRSIENNPFQKKAYYYRSQIYATGGDFENALQDVLEAQSLGVKVDTRYVEDLKKRVAP
ncbi:MAG: tetratricopeptide repeat protein [Candidatus Omnitrophica bacterium]|nr:tetratricopeptide repeat protein [Candidatus Omnitrophota bacterium]